MGGKRKPNPRNRNGYRSRQDREYWRSRGEPCALCGQPIDYSLTTWVDPKDGKRKPHPWSFELDHIHPVSRWREYGYVSAEACARDRRNQQPAHRECNRRKGDGRKRVKPLANIAAAFPTSQRW